MTKTLYYLLNINFQPYYANTFYEKCIKQDTKTKCHNLITEYHKYYDFHFFSDDINITGILIGHYDNDYYHPLNYNKYKIIYFNKFYIIEPNRYKIDKQWWNNFLMYIKSSIKIEIGFMCLSFGIKSCVSYFSPVHLSNATILKSYGFNIFVFIIYHYLRLKLSEKYMNYDEYIDYLFINPHIDIIYRTIINFISEKYGLLNNNMVYISNYMRKKLLFQ